ncbi:MAG: hypothetical protein RI897_3798, partial [Verrucomicrobiota bacterium]
MNNHRNTPHPPHLQAFTLIELTVSASLMAIILTTAYACLNATLASRRTLETQADVLQSGRVALNLIATDLRNACPLSPEFEFLGMNRTINETEADNLDFATHTPSPQPTLPRSDWCEVSYFLSKTPEATTWTLYRRRDFTPDNKPLSGGSREEVAQRLQGVRFEYYDGWDWYDEWGDPEGRRPNASDSLFAPTNLEGMPDAVRITLWFDVSETTRESKSTTLPPPVSLQTVAYLNLARTPQPTETTS